MEGQYSAGQKKSRNFTLSINIKKWYFSLKQLAALPKSLLFFKRNEMRIYPILRTFGLYWRFRETKWNLGYICTLRSRGKKNGDVYNGADDDGSGTVALLEIAEAFQRQKTVMVLNVHYVSCTTGEEHGLLGSSYYSEILYSLWRIPLPISISIW
jgi:hypothetical protein